MADENRNGTHSLMQRLAEAPYTFDFFQAVRWIECAHPGNPRFGTSVVSKDDVVRFCQNPSLAFAPSAISDYILGKDGSPSKMFVRFFGLLGPNAPLPLHITEYARERMRHYGDESLARFLDIFNHRMVSLFYRAWACNQKTVNYDRPEDDRFSVYIGSLLGIGMSSLRKRDAIPDKAKLYFSGHFVCQSRHAEGLKAILSGYFHVPVEIKQFFSHWINLPPASFCRLGQSPETGLLGSTAIVGERVWDCQNKFRIKMGPMDFAKYRQMLPGEQGLKQLVGWVRNYVGDRLAWEVQLVLRGQDIPQGQLGQMGQLGCSIWLKSRPIEKAVDDCVLEPTAA